MNTEGLRTTTPTKDLEGRFYFDPRVMDWADYFLNIHIPALVKGRDKFNISHILYQYIDSCVTSLLYKSTK